MKINPSCTKVRERAFCDFTVYELVYHETCRKVARLVYVASTRRLAYTVFTNLSLARAQSVLKNNEYILYSTYTVARAKRARVTSDEERHPRKGRFCKETTSTATSERWRFPLARLNLIPSIPKRLRYCHSRNPRRLTIEKIFHGVYYSKRQKVSPHQRSHS